MSKKRRRLIAFIDYDNVDSWMRKHNETLDFVGLMKEFKKIGEVDLALVWIPFGSYHSLPRINDLGFEVIVCQKLDDFMFEPREKKEDKVDSRIAIAAAANFLRYCEITDFVFLTHDKHIVELASEMIKKNKKLIFFAYFEHMRWELKEFIANYEIQVRPLPAKPRLMIA